MARRRPSGKRKSKPAGGVRAGAKKLARTSGQERAYENHYIPGFAQKIAAETGVTPTDAQVRRNPDFKAAVRQVLKKGRKSRAANSPLARALVTLGLRERGFRGKVGNSPDKGNRLRSQGGKRVIRR